MQTKSPLRKHRGVKGSPFYFFQMLSKFIHPAYLSFMSKKSGVKKITDQLRKEADKLRQWMYEHSSPSTSAQVFCEVANQYANLCAKIYIIEKHW
jgi:hypothetical protein